MANVIVVARVPPDLVQSLRVSARHADRSLSAEIRHAIRNHLANPRTSEGAPPQDSSGKTSDEAARNARSR